MSDHLQSGRDSLIGLNGSNDGNESYIQHCEKIFLVIRLKTVVSVHGQRDAARSLQQGYFWTPLWVIYPQPERRTPQPKLSRGFHPNSLQAECGWQSHVKK
jgi:hypothetical protein